jgi:hypothetical protein
MKLNSRAFLLTAMSSAVLTLASSAEAVSIDWKGTYRFEWTQIDHPSLGSTPAYGGKSYGLNYLSLSPKIIAADGVNIVSRFDVLANQNGYEDQQFGQVFGEGRHQTNSAANAHQRNVFANNSPSTPLRVQELYLNINQEFGALVVGRAPIEFGLGITHNAGNGPFDHWSDNEDLVGYKFIIDNFFVMPMLGRAYSNIYQGNEVQDLIVHAEYDSKESGSMIGLMYQSRKASKGVSDAPTITGTAGTTDSTGIPGATIGNGSAGEYDVTSTNLVIGREWESFAFKVEAGFNSGNLGLRTAAGEDISTNGYGVAAELMFPRKDSKLEWKVRLGMATGDDVTTASKYEAYQFDRNYDVAMLLFNHRLGQKYDYLTTNVLKDNTKDVSNSLDDEAIGNTMYIAPRLSYAWTDHVELNNTLTYAQLMTNPTGASGFDKALGFEWDIEVVYKPTDRLQWVNQLGILAPGAAFKGGADNLETATTFGLASKVAVTF